jgi:hypothetical protein
MFRGVYIVLWKGIGLLVHRCEKCVEIKGDCIEKYQMFHFCHLKKLVRPETFGPYDLYCENARYKY